MLLRRFWRSVRIAGGLWKALEKSFNSYKVKLKEALELSSVRDNMTINIILNKNIKMIRVRFLM